LLLLGSSPGAKSTDVQMRSWMKMKKKNTELTYRFRLGKTKIIFKSKVPFFGGYVCSFRRVDHQKHIRINPNMLLLLGCGLSSDTGKMATKNPVNSPVEVGGCLSNSFTRFKTTIPGGFLAGCLNHQQYTPED